MKNSIFNRWLWLFLVFLIRVCGLPFQLSPSLVPQKESAKIRAAVMEGDVIIIFNAGGWGDTPLNKTFDFAPILAGIQKTLADLGYRSAIVPYHRTSPGLFGKIGGTREQLNSFKNCYKVQVQDIRQASVQFPQKQFLLVGFSVGGGLSGRTLPLLEDCPNVYGITVGAPGWYRTYRSKKSLVLDNNSRDPLVIGEVFTIAASILKWPFFWLKYRRHKLSLAMALQFADHSYTWASVEVGPPIRKFLFENFDPK
jgi:hypothetical protein